MKVIVFQYGESLCFVCVLRPVLVEGEGPGSARAPLLC